MPRSANHLLKAAMADKPEPVCTHTYVQEARGSTRFRKVLNKLKDKLSIKSRRKHAGSLPAPSGDSPRGQANSTTARPSPRISSSCDTADADHALDFKLHAAAFATFHSVAAATQPGARQNGVTDTHHPSRSDEELTTEDALVNLRASRGLSIRTRVTQETMVSCSSEQRQTSASDALSDATFYSCTVSHDQYFSDDSSPGADAFREHVSGKSYLWSTSGSADGVHEYFRGMAERRSAAHSPGSAAHSSTTLPCSSPLSHHAAVAAYSASALRKTRSLNADAKASAPPASGGAVAAAAPRDHVATEHNAHPQAEHSAVDVPAFLQSHPFSAFSLARSGGFAEFEDIAPPAGIFCDRSRRTVSNDQHQRHEGATRAQTLPELSTQCSDLPALPCLSADWPDSTAPGQASPGHERADAAAAQPALQKWMECWPLYMKLMTEDFQWLEADAVLKHACQRSGLSCAAVARAVPKIADALAAHATLMRQVDAFLKELDNKEGYSQCSTAPLQTFYKHVPGQPIHQFKFIADFDCGMHEVLALVKEFDLVSTWNHLLIDSTVLELMGIMEMKVYNGIKLPWPLAARQTFVWARGSDCLLADGSALVLVESFEPSEAETVEVSKGRHTIRLAEGSGVRIVPLKSSSADGGQACRVYVQSNVDPRMPMVPAMVINFVLKMLAPVIYKMARKTILSGLRNEDGALYHRIQEQKDFYDWVLACTTRFLKQQAAK